MFDRPLQLKPTMTKSYLIQRLHKPYIKLNIPGTGVVDNPFSFGGGLKNGGLSDTAMDLLRGVMSFDYMGSAEFEFGAVPQAFAFIASQAIEQNLVIGEIFLQNQSVYYICPKPYEEEVKKRISALGENEHNAFRLKERCGLQDYLQAEEIAKIRKNPRIVEYYKKNVGWLELDNGFMFFTDKDMFKGVCKLFGVDYS
jgi:hypothetical protein